MIDVTLLEDYISETEEHLEEIEQHLLKLEADPGDLDLLNDIFRSVHTIKGAAEFVGVARVSELSHRVENLLETIRHGQNAVSRGIIDFLFMVRDRIARLNEDLNRSQREETDIDDLLTQIDRLADGSDDRNAHGHRDSCGPSEPEDGHPAGIPEWFSGASGADGAAPEIPTAPEAQDEGEKYGFPGDKFFLPDDGIREISYVADNRGNLEEEAMGEESRSADPDILVQGQTTEDDRPTGVDNAGLEDETVREANLLPEDDADPAEGTDDEDYGFAIDIPDPIGEVPDEEDDIPADETDIFEPEYEEPTADTIPVSDEEFETYEEDYDTELFEIFVENMHENFTRIRSLSIDADETRDVESAITRCGESVQSLKSSSNYMGYEKLTRLYERWLNDVESIDPLDEDPHSALQACTRAYITQAVRFFPSVAALQELLAEDEHPTSPTSEAVTGDVACYGENAAVDSDSSASTPMTAPFDEALFEKLSQAFDSGMQQANNEEATSRTSDMATGLFSDGDHRAAIPCDKNDAPLDPEALASPSRQTAPPSEVNAEAQLFSNTDRPVVENAAPEDSDDSVVSGENDDNVQSAIKEVQEAKSVKQSIRVEANKIDSLMNQVGELVVSRAWFSQLFSEMRGFERLLRKNYNLEKNEVKQVRSLTFRLSEATVALGRVANELQEGVMKIRMMPIAQLFNRYPRLVRELCRETGKSVQLDIRGEDTELDKMIIEEISDPLIHIIRNAVDHGIEPTRERLQKGKAENGQLVLEAFHESNHVVIEIRDDGRGIDPERIKAVAIEKHLYPPEELERMPTKELLEIIMKPSFSTAERVTHTSGRGVGMDVVRKNIEKLNGSLEIESSPGAGACIRIKIPLTLAIIPALLVRVGSETYTVPLAAVEETLRINLHETSYIEGIEAVHIRESTLPLIRLSEVFNLESQTKNPDQAFVVVVHTGMRHVGFVVDELIGQEEVVIKPLVDYLQDKSGFSGATIRGDGQISLILDVADLVRLSIAKKIRRLEDPEAYFAPLQTAVQAEAGVEAAV